MTAIPGSRLTLVRTAALALLASILAVAPPTGGYAGFSDTYLLQAVSAAAIVGAVVLGGQISRSLRWNKDPYRIGTMEVNE